ncbi:hypothetical protein Poli38472_008781 [Pythium oligandrum]|uniref:X-box-binding protein 1 n=1 Tax=Pythium oligandrum TaxID=41045 RepID=A0A8K1C480_PYTOL|nr:hypothetical protein Poli38472_008781 [Pythium oligandrum]|eukprot:TMW56133.1 hypothetical protein Poli38472_008781 [Pythium oligandrum]
MSHDGGETPSLDESDGASTVSESKSGPPPQRRRRKRIAIHLPPETVALTAGELKKLKNRVAAARARERTQHQIQELQAMVEQLWQENQQHKATIDRLRSVIQSLQSNHAMNAYHPAVAFHDSVAFQPPTALRPPPFAREGPSDEATSILADAAWILDSQSQPYT